METTNTDIQRNAFQITINNPKDKELDHKNILHILITNFKTLKYCCMADEIGANGTPHTHIYVIFSSRIRFSKIKKHFPSAHIEVAHGSIQSNLDYIRKEGKWQGTSKEETKVEGTFEELGEIPKQRGKKQELEELYELVKAGYTNAEILALNNDYILQIDKLDKLRTILLIEEYKGKRRTDLRCIYIYGATGTYKTRGVLEKHSDTTLFRVSDYKNPFDNYSFQSVMVLDEFRSQISISDMLNYMDIYPIELSARYANKYACYNTLYIISNWSLEEQYTEVQKSNPETWKAFLRRIHEVRHHKEDGSIDIYNSVDEYFNREEQFQPITAEEYKQINFDDEPFE